MALHGPILVNGVMVGEWGAQRAVYRDDPLYSPDEEMPYHAEVYKHGSKVWEGRVDHKPSDGPIALAAKVLTAAS